MIPMQVGEPVMDKLERLEKAIRGDWHGLTPGQPEPGKAASTTVLERRVQELEAMVEERGREGYGDGRNVTPPFPWKEALAAHGVGTSLSPHHMIVDPLRARKQLKRLRANQMLAIKGGCAQDERGDVLLDGPGLQRGIFDTAVVDRFCEGEVNVHLQAARSGKSLPVFSTARDGRPAFTEWSFPSWKEDMESFGESMEFIWPGQRIRIQEYVRKLEQISRMWSTATAEFLHRLIMTDQSACIKSLGRPGSYNIGREVLDQATAGQPRRLCRACGSPHHRQQDCQEKVAMAAAQAPQLPTQPAMMRVPPQTPRPQDQQPGKRGVCINWNKGRACVKEPCTFRHECRGCGASEPSAVCKVCNSGSG